MKRERRRLHPPPPFLFLFDTLSLSLSLHRSKPLIFLSPPLFRDRPTVQTDDGGEGEREREEAKIERPDQLRTLLFCKMTVSLGRLWAASHLLAPTVCPFTVTGRCLWRKDRRDRRRRWPPKKRRKLLWGPTFSLVRARRRRKKKRIVRVKGVRRAKPTWGPFLHGHAWKKGGIGERCSLR